MLKSELSFYERLKLVKLSMKDVVFMLERLEVIAEERE